MPPPAASLYADEEEVGELASGRVNYEMANAKTYRTSGMPIPTPHCFGDTERSKLKRRSRSPYPTLLGISSLWSEWEHYDAPATRISFMTHAAQAIISIFLPSNGEDDFL